MNIIHGIDMRFFIFILILITWILPIESHACCAVSAEGGTAINSDQSVILLWDKDRQTEHFIRKASFKGMENSLGFLVPSPSIPQLEESGEAAFPYLAKITAPPAPPSIPFGCAAAPAARNSIEQVRIIEEKTVAGYDTVVLAADSGKSLVEWLKKNQYAYTPEVATWAEPYLQKKWYMTAMKMSKSTASSADNRMSASALRISFKTDRPLFPYREPDSRRIADKLGVKHRLLRIYFIAEARYEGSFPNGQAWTGNPVWCHPLKESQRNELLKLLHLDKATGPAKFWLTEFIDNWPYGVAPGDVYFSRSKTQDELSQIKTPGPIDPSIPCMAAASLLWPLATRTRKRVRTTSIP